MEQEIKQELELAAKYNDGGHIGFVTGRLKQDQQQEADFVRMIEEG